MAIDTKGLLSKYHVSRLDGSDQSGGKHEDCWYFVLDPLHDEDARAALAYYARRVKDRRPQLSRELKARVDALEATTWP
jgi:hypothetical protein